MSGDPNFNEMAAHVIETQINNAINAVSNGIKGAIAKVLASLNKDLKQYTAAKIRKCSYVRTPIINRDRSTPIYDIYVHTRLKVTGKIVEDDDFIAALRENDSVVITGSAGSGKSMLMRHLFLALCSSATNSKIPLFFELRDIDVPEKKTLREFLYYNLIGSNATITESQFHDSLKAGVFSLVLDGFDEINFKERKDVERQIRKLREQCPDLQIIVSSRPDADRSVESWQDFRTVYVQPMNESQTAELIRKLDYDVDVKEKFLKETEVALFKSHESFLSNPLLCVMMLVTFQQTGHIPTKRHVFYEQAFDALFSLHDSSKEGVYKRKTYAELSIDEFRNCMSAFCIVTYLKERFSFSRGEFREALQAALNLEKLSINIDNLTNDMIESTCLIQIEGTDYVFTHQIFSRVFLGGLYFQKSSGRCAKVVGSRVDTTNRRRNTDGALHQSRSR
jgi:energy-coupling factor transporter ATP-binding protein EcfA2